MCEHGRLGHTLDRRNPFCWYWAEDGEVLRIQRPNGSKATFQRAEYEAALELIEEIFLNEFERRFVLRSLESCF